MISQRHHREPSPSENATSLLATLHSELNNTPITNLEEDSLDSKTDKIRSQGPIVCDAQVLFACSLFMVTGPLLIMTNKAIITELEFKYPVIVTSFGIISSSIFVHLLHWMGYVQIRSEIKQLVTWRFLFTRIFIISFLQSLTMYFGNKAYLFLSVSLIQMLKAFTPVITMFFGVASKQQSADLRIGGAILLLSFGTFLTSTGASEEDKQNAFGFVLCVFAQCTEALKLTLQQQLLQGFTIKCVSKDSTTGGEQVYEKKVKFTIFEGLYYYAPMTFLSICVIVVPLEMREFISNWDTNRDIIRQYYLFFLVAALLGFFVNIAAFMVTKVTSGLYLKALNAFRNVCLVSACVILFGDIVTNQQIIGYAVTLCGFAYYNYVVARQK